MAAIRERMHKSAGETKERGIMSKDLLLSPLLTGLPGQMRKNGGRSSTVEGVAVEVVASQ